MQSGPLLGHAAGRCWVASRCSRLLDAQRAEVSGQDYRRRSRPTTASTALTAARTAGPTHAASRHSAATSAIRRLIASRSDLGNRRSSSPTASANIARAAVSTEGARSSTTAVLVPAERGPVLVTRSYTIGPDQVDGFVGTWKGVRRSRMRTGATSCALYRDGANPSRFVEVSLYPTWAEHLRQHEGRLTGADREVEEAARAMAGGGPHVEHLSRPTPV